MSSGFNFGAPVTSTGSTFGVAPVPSLNSTFNFGTTTTAPTNPTPTGQASFATASTFGAVTPSATLSFPFATAAT